MRRLYAVPSWAWLALAFALRVGFALKLGGRFIQTDEIGYVEPAKQLLETGVLGTRGEPRILPPLPAAFYAFFFSMGESLVWPRLGLAVLGVLVCRLVEGMTQAITGSRGAARLALAISVVYPFFVYYGGAVMSELPTVAAVSAALWATGASLADRGRSWRLAAAAGLAWAACALIRPQALPTALLLWAALALACARGRWRWSALAACLLAWSLPLLGWAARNQAAAGRFAVDAHGGVSMLHGTKYFEENELDTGVAMQAIRESDFYRRAELLPEAERDKVYLAEALKFVRENPGTALKQFAYKFGKFWRLYPRTTKVYAEHEHSHPTAGLPRWALTAVSLAFEPWLIVLGFWGLWELKGRRLEVMPAVLWLAATCAIHTLVVSTMRYRVPVMPVLIMGASFWIAKRIGEPRTADR